MTPLPPSLPALVTGASSGIGEAFATALAERGHALTLVARRGDRLERIARRLRAEHGVTVTVLIADLETEPGLAAVAGVLAAGGPWLLVNNAGFGARGAVLDIEEGWERSLIAVNVVALHRLLRAVLPGNVAAGGGGIINVASTAAFQPMAYFATYAASKAFVLHLTEGLAEEIRGTGTRVMALCPGPVRTEFGEVAGGAEELERMRPMDARTCVDIALRAFNRGDVICVPGTLNHAGTMAVRLLPRFAVRRVLGVVARPR